MNELTNRSLAGLAGLGSAALLLAALTFQYFGYAPCELCILQRWPHLAAAVIGLAIWAFGWHRALAILGLLAALVATAFAIFHTGVELKYWAGPAHCSGGISHMTQLSTTDLMAQLQAAPVVRCDEAAWSLLGISMAGWNAICSAILSLVWAASALRRV